MSGSEIAESVWKDIVFPDPPAGRPWICLNMISTIDGKITTGAKDEPVYDLGSKTDHATMRGIEAAVDGLIMGAGTIRATPRMNLRAGLKRYGVTLSGNLDASHPFFATNLTGSWVVCPESSPEVKDLPAIRAGRDEIDFHRALEVIHQDHGVRVLLSEGGGDLNAAMFAQNLIDEIFLTLAPKIKLGEDTPTMAGGTALPRPDILKFELVAHQVVGSELFLRYRRHH